MPKGEYFRSYNFAWANFGRDEFLQLYQKSQILVFVGETG